MDRKDSNERTSSVNALQSRENAALLNEVHDVEDRIDIATMEIEDLEDYCAMVAGEIQFLRSRLDKSPDFKEASDRKFLPLPENSLETSGDRSTVPAASAETSPAGEKHPDILSGEPADGVPEYQPESSEIRDSAVWEAVTGENVLDPFAPSEEEDKRKPKPEKSRKKKKQKDESGEPDGQETKTAEKEALKEPEPVIVTPSYRAMMMEQEGGAISSSEDTDPEPEEDAGVPMDGNSKEEQEGAEAEPQEESSGEFPGDKKTAGESALGGKPSGDRKKTAEGSAEPPAQEKEPKKRRFHLPGRSGERGRKKNADRIYCPNCGSFIGEDRKCPWCGTRVK